MKQNLAHTSLPTEEEYVELIRSFHLPRYNELPDIELYMDQLLTYVDRHLRPLVSSDEKLLTSSMVNNYVKQRIIPMPERKRYNRLHVASLIVVCLMKRTFSVSDIQKLLLAQQSTHEAHRSYDFFCTAVEESLRAMFCAEVHAKKLSTWEIIEPNGFAFSLNVKSAHTLTAERRLAIACATSTANKIYVEKCFELGILDGAK